MNNMQPKEKKLDSNQPHHSDGSELIPAEVEVDLQHDDEKSTEGSAVPGSTIDDEGRLNNFAVEPKIYPSEYPSLPQQRRYIYWGVAAVSLVVLLILISRFVS